MGQTRFPRLHALLSGSSASGSARGRDDDDQQDDGNSIDANALDRALGAEVDSATRTAAADATKAANDRWHKVMTSDAARDRPGMAARLCARTTMSADDVIETLGEDNGGKRGANSERDDLDENDLDQDRPQGSAGTRADRLRGGRDGDERREQRDRSGDRRDARRDPRGAGRQGARGGELDPDTGGGDGGGRESRAGSARERFAATQKQRNENALGGRAAGGKGRS